MKFFQLILLILPQLILSEPIVLTDKTWREMLCGQWMVEFYAPWCPSCQHFNSIWNEFSKAMIPKEIQVAAIDINQFPSLSGRFGISVLPTIYYVRDGTFRHFQGERSLNGLKNYIELEQWKKTTPVSSYLSPDSVVMSIIGSIFDVSLWVKNAYTILQDQYGWPSWSIFIVLSISVIFVGLIIGFGILMLIDYCLTGFSKDETYYIPDDSRDPDDLEDFEDQKLLKPKSHKNNIGSRSTITASTPQRGNSRKAKLGESPVEEEEESLNEIHENFDDEQAETGDRHDQHEISNPNNETATTDDENHQKKGKNKNLRQRRKR